MIAALMAARRAVSVARRRGDPEAVRIARGRIDRAKRALGERGPVWWTDGAPDYNRRLVHNTPYREWFERIQEAGDSILTLLAERDHDASICPSEAARAVAPRDWRSRMEEVRQAARHMAQRGAIVIRQRGRTLDPEKTPKGPIRYARA